MTGAPALRPVPLELLLERVAHEWSTRHRIFDLPSARFWKRPTGVDVGIEFLGRHAASPLGPAAGPHSQMAQNLVLAWLGGARVFELKTIQADDELHIGRPCIDTSSLTFNTEVSQELRLAQSLEEYVKASMIIEILGRWEPLTPFVGNDPGPRIFDISVGYDLRGVTHRKVAGFIDAMTDAREVVDRLRDDIPDAFAQWRDLDFGASIATSATLSTFHGCPPSEIEAIVKHLVDRHHLDVVVKLNPTLLGFSRVSTIVHEVLGHHDVRLDPHTFPDELQFDHATRLIERLADHAASRNRRFGIKLTNTLVVDREPSRLAGDPVYLSGAPLHVLATTLLDDLINDMPGVFDICGHNGPVPISFSAGVTAENIADTLAMGVRPVTVCTDLLQPGGYGRIEPMLRRLESTMTAAGVTTLPEWHELRWRSAREAGYRGPVEEHMAALLAGGQTSAYGADAVREVAPTVDHDLEMWGCVACNRCVTVCPNDAFFAVRTPPELGIPGRQQYLVLAELCNDCGNCTTFCPERGDPSRIKPRLFLDRRDFAAEPGQAFLLSTGDDPTVAGSPGQDADAELLSQLLSASVESPPIVLARSRHRPRIDRRRLMQRIDELAAIGAIEGTRGCARLALTDEDRAGRDLVVTWMRDLGLDIRIDGIGNVVATTPWPDDTAPVLTGSHIDTVATGGRYDGNLGVLAGLEVIETVLNEGIQLVRPIAVAFFTDEEGSRYPPDMLGSLVYVGGMPVEDALSIRGIDGSVLGDELDRIGYRGSSPLPARAPYAYIELHIEQGPVLERVGRRIGAVTGVQGISWTEVTIDGQSNHAGTTPMAMRRDPAVAAGHVITFVHQLAAELGPPQVATVGKIDLVPNLVNVVPARATLTVDLRNTDAARLADAEGRLASELGRLERDLAVSISTRSLARFEPVQFDESIVGLVEAIALDHGYDSMRMPSGAGHDAQMLAAVTRAGMIFVPSHQGLSHNPAEHTDADDIEAGATVLLDAILALATEPVV